LIQDEYTQFMKDKMFIYLTQLAPDQDNTKEFAKLDKRLLKAIGKLSRNFREGWYAGKFKTRQRRGRIYCLRDRQLGNWKTPRNKP
jgi:hypothetical protein